MFEGRWISCKDMFLPPTDMKLETGDLRPNNDIFTFFLMSKVSRLKSSLI